jgi:PAS domain S-box-containing protein
MHGYAPGELNGKTIWELLASRVEQNAFRAALEERIAHQPPPYSYTTRHRRKDGRIIDLQIDWTYKRDARGEVTGFVSIVTDITQNRADKEALANVREEIEQRVIRHRETLAAADEDLRREVTRRKRIEDAMRRSKRLASVGVLAAGIAHEINNPIAAVLNSAETALAVRDESDSKAMMVECLDNIVQSARRCGAIVKDLLKFASQEPTQKQPVPINHVVNQATRTLQKVVSDSGASLEVNLADETIVVVVNVLEMEIAVGNLVQNAIEASSHNGAPVRITIETGRAGDDATLVVRDDGCGIKKSDLDRIFDPFFTTRKASGGTGLGLSIAYAIVQNHRGTIVVETTLGAGTAITLRLPVAPTAIADRP